MSTSEATETAVVAAEEGQNEDEARTADGAVAERSATSKNRFRPGRRGITRVLRRLRRAGSGFAASLFVIAVTGTAAVWSHARADAVRAAPAMRNEALTDVAATADAKSQITRAVDALFSLDFTAPAVTDAAASRYLTGAAITQYATLMSPIRAHASDLKLMLTTTVTSAGVQTLRGERARVLVFADQTDTSTATAGTSESAAAFPIDAVHVGGMWRIAGINASP